MEQVPVAPVVKKQIYMKHAELGNEYFDESEQSQRESEGWVRWPRTAEQKAAECAPVASPSASALPERSALETTAKQLDINIDGRWSDKRLAEEIRKVEADLNS